jgi:hypothetical protein
MKTLKHQSVLLFGLLMALALCCFGCKTSSNGHVLVVTDRFFGFEADENPVNQSPRLRAGFGSQQVMIEPVNTNALYTPSVASTFSLDNSGSPFTLGINETFASGGTAGYRTGNTSTPNSLLAAEPALPNGPVQTVATNTASAVNAGSGAASSVLSTGAGLGGLPLPPIPTNTFAVPK